MTERGGNSHALLLRCCVEAYASILTPSHCHLVREDSIRPCLHTRARLKAELGEIDAVGSPIVPREVVEGAGKGGPALCCHMPLGLGLALKSTKTSITVARE
jgi:hypothetical protein